MFVKCLPWIIIINAHNILLRVGTIIIFILQMVKMRLKEVSSFVPTGTANNVRDSHLSSLIWVLPLSLNMTQWREDGVNKSESISNWQWKALNDLPMYKEVERWKGLQVAPVTSLNFISLEYWIKLAFHFWQNVIWSQEENSTFQSICKTCSGF